MKQLNLFGEQFRPQNDSIYTGKVETPIYEPKNQQPHIIELVDVQKAHRLIKEIEFSNVTDAEKKFLIMAAYRHYIFNYQIIADYYAHASAEMQKLMEKSALIIIDFEKAIELGYVQLSEHIKKQYLNEYE